MLLDRAENHRGWTFKTSLGTNAKVRMGELLSAEKLVDNAAYRNELRIRFPDAIGGEMEANGVAAACDRNRIEWLVAKAICDWGDGKKSKEFQREAARVSVDFLHSMFEDDTGFAALGMSPATEQNDEPSVLHIRSMADAVSCLPAIRRLLASATVFSNQDVAIKRVANFIAELALNAFQHGRATYLDVELTSRGFRLNYDGGEFDPRTLVGNATRGGTYTISQMVRDHSDAIRLDYQHSESLNVFDGAFYPEGVLFEAERCKAVFNWGEQVWDWNDTCSIHYVHFDENPLSINISMLRFLLGDLPTSDRVVGLTSDPDFYSQFLEMFEGRVTIKRFGRAEP